ncbi:indole-3-glycerol phosphate synthase TrpC [candidate division KSB1 bacterium]|nr:indole-3-glycerol phosphate synthase TrpC [candidate division KSB1 bacterium]NIR68946.1 indole-3-glycerol phosphate synthase TrpC [candidate division KSB1 bacterium]NIS27283.1 indole-3-glycerol phosphate synthase TrpC [candidate division KSB1 bacterium]NIT74162.1 indole-3-glycerol phosphate synthase TrpC [candidate division KSB1 bacterium]NIU28013.1 indole-3-glycerol phosphate synthase TrpC [candidate division KSB1 bacterium]
MASILDKIVEHKKQELKKLKRETPVSKLFARVQTLPAPKPFSSALKTQSTVAIIAEVKKASPSAGCLREDFDPVAIATGYEKNGASAVSVLTDERFFEGSLVHLQRIREQVQLPILRKDFMLDPYQIVEARAYGADTILLILGMLSDRQCSELVAAAREFKLDILAEVHTAADLERTLATGLTCIGINNRNLKTSEVDLNTTTSLIGGIPKEVTVVSESGIKHRNDIERVAQSGVDAVLVGETLMRQPDVGLAVRQFLGAQKWSR